MIRTTRPRLVRLLAAAAITVTGLLATPAAVAGSSAHHTRWRTLSVGSIGTTATTPSIARFGNRYEVVWVARSAPSSYDLQARILDAKGKPVGPLITVLSGWAHLQGDPTIFSDGSNRVIAFGGDQTGGSGSYDNGAEYLLTSTDGRLWALSTGSLSAADHADRDNGTAVVDVGGTIITGLAENGGVRYHLGGSAANPAPGPDPLTATTSRSAAPGLGANVQNQQVWAVWYSAAGGRRTAGVNAQLISPTRGTRAHAPGSANRAGKSTVVPQDLSVAARTRGGVYTAYASPNDATINVWRLGASRLAAKVRVPTYGAGSIVVTAAPRGRLWLYWRDRNGWRAARSNKAATRFGKSTILAIPKHRSQNVAIAGTAGAGGLEAIATVTTTRDANKIIGRQIPVSRHHKHHEHRIGSRPGRLHASGRSPH